jgi:hypothetical protein
MLDGQQALYLPNIRLKMVLPYFQWLFKCLPLFPIEEHQSNHGEIENKGEMWMSCMFSWCRRGALLFGMRLHRF